MSSVKHFIPILLIAASFLSSCGTEAKLSYYWGGNKSDATAYESSTYDYYKHLSPQSLCALMVMYQDVVSNPSSSANVPPPGVCAEFGYLLTKAENVDIYTHNATKAQLKKFSSDDYFAYGVKLIQMEVEYYPEAAQFLKPILDNINKQEEKK